jgi:uncharacterized protein YbjT (DUF2867 family)
MKSLELTPEDRVLILGATGFIGKRLLPALLEKNIKLRLLVRNLSKAEVLLPAGSDVEIVKGDLIKGQGVQESLQGIHTAFYLVHSLGGTNLFKNNEFARMDKRAAEIFISAG